jgi:hypothetical protein
MRALDARPRHGDLCAPARDLRKIRTPLRLMKFVMTF